MPQLRDQLPRFRDHHYLMKGETQTIIRDSNLDNGLPPNFRISVKELAQDLGIGPTPVQEEALRQLQADSLMCSEAHKGIRVAEQLSKTDVRDTYEVRCALETHSQ